VKLVCNEMIPLVAKRSWRSTWMFIAIAGRLHRTIGKVLAAARKNGLGTRAHVCQFTAAKLGPLLAHQPASFDHMDCVQAEDISLLAHGETVAVLLPGANYFLGHASFPDARRLIDAGAPVALATDYNPGTSPTPSMPFVISLACTHMKMTPRAIASATINAACALRAARRKAAWKRASSSYVVHASENHEGHARCG